MKLFVILLLAVLTSNVWAESLSKQIENRKKNSKGKVSAEVKKEFTRAIEELKATGIEQKSLQKGVKVPNFPLTNDLSIADIYKEGVTVISFYRGHWCPYCMLQLKEFERLLPKFNQADIQLIVITPDMKKQITKTKVKNKLSFQIYSDPNNAIAKQFGIAFKVDEKVAQLYKNFGIDLDDSQGNTQSELPMPGTYIVDSKGMIRYAFATADYTKRAEPLEVLNLAKKFKE